MPPASSKEFIDIQANYRVWVDFETHMWHDNSIQLRPFTQLRPSGIIWVKISLHFICIRFLNVGTTFLLLSLLFLVVVSFYFGIKQLQYKTNTIPVYICYSWFNSWLLLSLILYSCCLLFLLFLFFILMQEYILLFLIWCGYIFPSINKPDIDIITIY